MGWAGKPWTRTPAATRKKLRDRPRFPLPPIQSRLLQRKLKRREEVLAGPEAYRKQQTIQGERPSMLQGWS